MKLTYNEMLEMIIDYQAALSKALINYDYNNIEIYSKKIQVIINRILKDNLIYIEKKIEYEKK